MDAGVALSVLQLGEVNLAHCLEGFFSAVAADVHVILLAHAGIQLLPHLWFAVDVLQH